MAQPDVDVAPAPDVFRGALRKQVFFKRFTPGAILDLKLRNNFSFWCGLFVSLKYLIHKRGRRVCMPFAKEDFVDPSGIKGVFATGWYFDFLKHHHPRAVDRKKFDEFVKKRLPGREGSYVKIPDILTNDRGANIFHVYEIKPDNEGGIEDGRVKMFNVLDFLRDNKLNQYVPGDWEGGKFKIFEGQVAKVGFVVAHMNIRHQKQGIGDPKIGPGGRSGLLVYEIELEFDFDPGPEMTEMAIRAIVFAVVELGAFALAGALGEATAPAVAGTEAAATTTGLRVATNVRVASEVATESATRVRVVVGEALDIGESIVKKSARALKY